MGDEQTILLSPEEELTSVRERLERTQARRITLVIPAQTQLRSHVGWRLIHARMRELGKDLLVISPDRQVRAVARAAGFQVAETQQEASSNRPRLGGTRPGGMNTRSASRSRVGSSRGGPESRPSQQPGSRRRLSSNMGNRPGTRPSPPSNRPGTRPSAPGRSDYAEEEETFERARRGDTPTRQRPQSLPPSLLEDLEDDPHQAYNFSIQATPSARHSVPDRDDEDDEEAFKNTYEADYKTAQDILKAASEGKPASSALPGNRNPRASSGQSRFEEIEEGVPDIADRSTEIMESEIEDLGDMGSIELPEIREEQAPDRPGGQQYGRGRSSRSASGQIQPGPRHSPRAPRPTPLNFDDDDDLLAMPEPPPRGVSGSSRSSRGLGQDPRRSQALKPGQGQRSSQALGPGASQRPSSSLAPGQRGSQSLDQRAGQRPSQTLSPGQGQRGSRGSQALDPRAKQRSSQALSPGEGSRGSHPSRTASRGSAGLRVVPGGQSAPRRFMPPTIGRQRAPRGSSRGMAIFLTALALLLVVAIALFYFVPSATVTVVLAASPYTQPVHINATTTARPNAPDQALAHVLVYAKPVSDQGTAHGTTRVGNAQAQGTVTFTNTGHTNVDIPINTVITTPGGTQFVTAADAVVVAGNPLAAVPITAQQAGEGGNVGANTITVIPQNSLNAIAQHSRLSPNAVTANNLAVTNDQPTSGGGAANVAAVTQGDAQAMALKLHQDLQQALQNWLGTQIHPGDVHGQLAPDVLGSSKPLADEQVSVTPQVGQPDSSGTFSGTLTLQVSVLVVRAKDLQAAAGRQLNAAAAQLHPAKMLAAQLPITLKHVQSTSSPDGRTLAISANAGGGLIPQLDPNAIASSLTNKGLSQAQSDLKNGVGIPNLTGVKNVKISIFPSFFSILPFQAGRIHVILQPDQVTSPPAIKNGS